MGAAGEGALTDADQPGFDLEHLRAQALPLVLAAMLVPAFGLIVSAAVDAGPVAPERIAAMVALFGLAAAAHAVSGQHRRAASAIAVVGLLAIGSAGALSWLGFVVAPWLSLVVPVAVALLGWRAGADAALPGLAASLAVLPWASLAAYWLLSRPVQTALEWSWASYLRSERLAVEARERQAELGRLSKSLNETCYQLEVANHELERARRAAEEARRVKAEFAAAVSHELRAPLNLIIGFSEMMVTAPHTYHDEVLPEGYRGDVQAIYRAACHLSGLVDDVLDLAEVEAHRMALEKERVALPGIVDEALATVGTLFSDRGLSLTADLTRVRQILINLLTNAARFTSAGGATVRARRDGRDVVVTVEDTGVGIPAEEVPSLSGQFHRSAGSAPGPYGGRGLGQTICRRFVEMHGGATWVESSPGRGSAFSFSLPGCETVVAGSSREEWQTWATPVGPTPEPLVALVASDDARAGLFARYLDGHRLLHGPDADLPDLARAALRRARPTRADPRQRHV